MRIIWILLIAMLSCFSRVVNAQKAELAVQVGHTKSVRAVAWSPDGKTLASCSGVDGTIKIWDFSSGHYLRTLKVNSSALGGMRWSADGNYVLVSGEREVDDKSKPTLWQCDVRTGQIVQTFESTLDDRTRVYSPTGKQVAEGTIGSIGVQSVESQKIVEFKGHIGFIGALAWDGKGKVLASGGFDRTVRLWDAATGKLIHALYGHLDRLNSVSLSADGTVLASTDSEAFLAEKNVVMPPGVKAHKIHDIALWDAVSGRLLRTIPGQINGQVVSLSGDGKMVAAGDDRGGIRIYEVSSGRLVHSLIGATASFDDVCLSADGQTIALAQSGGVINVWDVAHGKSISTLKRSSDYVKSVAMSADGQTLASIDNSDDAVNVWNVKSGKLLQSFNIDKDYTTNVSLSADGKTLAAGGEGDHIRVWDTLTGNLKLTLDGLIVSLSNNGEHLALLSDYDDDVKVYDVKTGQLERILKGHTADPEAVTWSADGTMLASGDYNGNARVWEFPSGKLLHNFTGAELRLRALAFSADNRLLITGGFDGEVRLWDVQSGKKLKEFKGHTESINRVAFSPDGKTLITSSDDTSLRFWDVNSGSCKLTLYSINAEGRSDNYAIIDAAGRFDGTDKALEALHYVVDLEPIALDQLKERYYQPGLWGKVMGGNREPLREVPQFNEVALYPEVSVTPPVAGSTKLAVRLKKRSGGYGKVEVKVADTNIFLDARPKGFDAAAPEQSFEINLLGANISPGATVPVSVVAWNEKEDVRSRGILLESFVMPGQKVEQIKPRFFAVVVGTSSFANPLLNLRFAAKDAIYIAQALKQASPSELFASSDIQLLTTEATDPNLQPSKTNIADAFARVAKEAKENDVVVLYFSGHGIGLVRGNKNFYCYLTRDALSADEETFKDQVVLNGTTVNSNDLDRWLTGPNRIKARKRVLILDTCAAGAFAQNQPLADQKDVSSDILLALDKLRDNTGYHVLMGCAAIGKSYEANRYGQGLLTYSLLKYMKYDGIADGREVDVNKLFQHAATDTRELAKLNFLTQQPRILSGEGNSFPIGVLDDKSRADVPLALAKPVILRPALTNLQRRFDNLKLSGAIQARLKEICLTESRGSKTPVYIDVDWESYADGVQPAGNYRIEGDQVNVELVLVRGGEESKPIFVQGPSTDADRTQLVDAIVESILKANTN